MTVAFRSTATATQPANTDGISVTVTKPTGTANGDLMIAVTHGYTPDSFTAPTGWTFLQSLDDSTGLRSRAYWKIAASEGASYVWQFQPGVGGGTIGVSITSFSGSAGLDAWRVLATSTSNPADGLSLDVARNAMRYDVFCWRDTVTDSVTWATGTESHDISVRDAGTIWRGQSGVYSNTLTPSGTVMAANTATAASAPTFAIQWSFAIADTAPAAESYASTGFGVEAKLGGVWTDITPDILYEQKITTTQGTSSEGGDASPGSMGITLKNTTGKYSPPNPNGSNFGNFNLNTQARWWEALGTVGMLTTGQVGDRYRCPVSSTLMLSGDLDVRVDAEPKTWRQQQVLAANAVDFGAGAGDWVFYIDAQSYPHIAWSDGILSVNDVACTVQVPEAFRQTVRVTLDVDNGASGHTVTFYTSDSVTGTFTQLGATVITPGVTQLFPDPAYGGITVGSLDTTTVEGGTQFPDYSAFRGRIYGMVLKSSIGGTTVASPDFSAQTTGTYGFTDAQGNIWSALGGVVCTNRRYMFHGQLSSAPLSWDTTGTYVVADATFSGILRQVQRNSQPIRSALYRYFTGKNGVFGPPSSGFGVSGPFFPHAYWPLEDGAGSKILESVYPDGGHPGRTYGAVEFGDYGEFAASDPIAHMVTGSELWLGVKQAGFTTGAFSVSFLLSAPSGITAGATIMNIWTSGTDRRFALTYPSTNHLQLTSYDASGTQIATSGSIAVTVAGALLMVTIDASNQDGAASFNVQPVGDTDLTFGGSLATSAIQTVTSVTVNPGARTMNDVYVGHVAVFDGAADGIGLIRRAGAGMVSLDPLNAFTGEAAADRVRRLTEEEGFIPYNVGGETAPSLVTGLPSGGNGEPLGGQTSQSFIENLRTAETSDYGSLVEARDCLGIGYRTRESQYNQAAVLTLNYANGELSGDLLPDYDDLQIVNKITVTRTGGGSYLYEITAGPRGSDTAGTYPDAVELSLADDTQLPDQAGFRTRASTVPEYRFPSVTLAAENRRVAASSTQSLALLRLDIGDRIIITNPPAWLPPEDISQVIVGVERSRDKFQHGVVLHTVPESPYRVGVLGSSTRKPRAGAVGSTLATSATTTAVSLSVASVAGSARWADSATYSSSFPFDIVIDGERITVTAVTGTTSPQTFTVTRSVNGVVKTHNPGAAVSLYSPTYASWRSGS